MQRVSRALLHSLQKSAKLRTDSGTRNIHNCLSSYSCARNWSSNIYFSSTINEVNAFIKRTLTTTSEQVHPEILCQGFVCDKEADGNCMCSNARRKAAQREKLSPEAIQVLRNFILIYAVFHLAHFFV